MQTLHLRFRYLRAISREHSPRRWRPRSAATGDGRGGAFALPNPPEPTWAVGLPAGSLMILHPDLPRGRGSGEDLANRMSRNVRGPAAPPPRPAQRCRAACPVHLPAAGHGAGQAGAQDRQARRSAVLGTASAGLFFSLRPQRHGARAGGKRTRTTPCIHPRRDAGSSCTAWCLRSAPGEMAQWPAIISR